MACNKLELLNNNFCYKFVWFDGSHMAMWSNKFCRGQTTQATTSKISTFKFLYDATSRPTTTFLSLNPKSKQIEIFEVHRSWFNVSIYPHVRHKSLAKGFVVCFGNMIQSFIKLDNTFVCVGGKVIAAILKCDGHHDCNDLANNSSDEINCAFVHTDFKYTGKFNLYQRNEKGYFVVNTTLNATQSHCENNSPIDSILANDLLFDCTNTAFTKASLRNLLRGNTFSQCPVSGEIPCSKGQTECFSVTDVCFYKLNVNNKLTPCRSGGNLENCHLFECNNNFKCPNYYCVPFAYVCDGKWDCPQGQDEHKLHMCSPVRHCKFMLQCMSSVICIHTADVCNEYQDCPHGEDETLCDTKNTCPHICQCVLYFMACFNKSTSSYQLTNLPYVSYYLSQVHLTSIKFMVQNNFAAFIALPNNKISDICSFLSLMYKLKEINVASNRIHSLDEKCFHRLHSLKVVQLSNNLIFEIASASFSSLQLLALVNLSHNKVTSLKISIFQIVTQLSILDLSGNKLSHTSILTDWSLILNFFLTEDICICCTFSKEIICSAKIPWFLACNKSLPRMTMNIVMVIVSIMLLLLNMSCLLLFSWKAKVESKGKAYFVIVCFVSVVNILCGAHLSTIWVSHLIQNKTFSFYVDNWQSVFTSSSAFVLATDFSLSLPCTLLYLCLCRFMVIIYPFNARFKSVRFVLKCLIYSLLVTTTLSVLFCMALLSHNQEVSTYIYTPFKDPENIYFEIRIFTWFCFIVHCITFIIIFVTYVFLSDHLSKKSLTSSNTKNSASSTLIEAIKICVIFLLSWLPSDILYLIAFFLVTYSPDMLKWNLFVVVPIGPIVIPAMFFLSVLRLYFKNKKDATKTNLVRGE